MQGCTGGDWVLRVNSEVINASMSEAPQRISIIFYIADSQVGVTPSIPLEPHHFCLMAMLFKGLAGPLVRLSLFDGEPIA